MTSFMPLNVQRVTNSSTSSDDAVVMVKLTDEMFAALEQCQKNGKTTKIRIRVDEHGGIIEIGDGHASTATNNTFRFQKQVLSDATDTLIQTGGSGGSVRNVGTYRTKYQIQATDKSFEETRKKAERRAEVEKRRGTKEMKKNVTSNSRYLNSSSSTPRNMGSLSTTSSSLRASPSFMGSTKASTSQSIGNNSSSTMSATKTTPTDAGSSTGAALTTATSLSTTSANPNRSDMLKPELMRKSLKKRVIHLIVTQKYRNWEEVHQKLLADGLSDDKNIPSRIEACVREVSEQTPTSLYLSLRPLFMSEVDARWPFFNQDEKAMVRRLQTSQNGAGARQSQIDSASFAPMRKKGMERLTASSRSNGSSSNNNNNNNNNNTNNEKVAPPPPPPPAPTSGEVLGNSGKKAEKELSAGDSDEDIYASKTVKRKAHNSAAAASVASSIATSGSGTTPLSSMEKRARRNDSASPPEDPMTTTTAAAAAATTTTSVATLVAPQNLQNHHHHNHHHHHQNSHQRSTHQQQQQQQQQQLNASGGGSTASSRISSPASSLSSPSQPSCDWEKEFGEIKTMPEAEQYFGMFHKEYPIYMECYRKLAEVSREFRSLESKLTQAMSRKKKSTTSSSLATSSKEIADLERHIQNRYAFFEKDPEFLRARQKHTDLRSKLAVLKTRINNWEGLQQRQSSM